MTIHRIPVIEANGPGTGPGWIPHALPCRGCATERAASTAESFRCPNIQPRGSRTDPSHCLSTCFLYPRGIKSRGWHFHQGVDISGREGVAKIISVTDGTVYFARNERTADHYTGYGKVVVVYTEPYYYLYAHCHEVFVRTGDSVRQQDLIATVGRTQYLSDGRVHSDTMGPHLHFEVSTAQYPVRGETTLDDPDTGARIDPRAHLESLGPWGARRFYFPLVAGGTDEASHEVSPESVARMYEATERDNLGGYFPLGANNIWHGGVHLRGGGDALVRAPFDGTIVAARLDADPVRARGTFGSLDFILMQHELPSHIAERLRGTTAPAREAWQGAVGQYRGTGRRRREVPNAPEHVREVKRLLHDAGFYAPEDPALLEDGATVDPALLEAIVAFQATFSRRPDGVVDIPGTTYGRLRQLAQERQREAERAAARARGEPEPRPDVVYSLFMHLRPETLDDTLARRIDWLTRVTTEPTATEREREQAERAARQRRIDAERTEDGADAEYALGGDVGPPRRRRGPPNHGEDVAWVQRRLIRHGAYEGEADGQWSDALDAAIRSFQGEHVAYYRDRGRRPDAEISASGGTEQALRSTPTELQAAQTDPAAGVRRIDARFVARASELDEDTGMARVVTGLDVRVVAGEPLWTAGVGLGFAELSGGEGAACGRGMPTRGADATQTQPVIHWEIFSEEALVGAWDRIDEDGDEDLVVDVPRLVNAAQARAEAAAEPHDEAYDEEQTEPGAAAEGGEPLGEDEVLSVEEIRAFYASERSRALRQTQCRFHSEWALDLDATVAALGDLGWNTRCLRSQMEPYMWWAAAGDAVPASPLVWHYNPIAFLDLYRQQFPPPPVVAPVVEPPATDGEMCGPAPLCE